jgi:hypothetical protein
LTYNVGEEDVVIKITPTDLGITGFWGTICGSFCGGDLEMIPMQELYEEACAS